MSGYVNIMCLYWEGDFRGRNFTVDDIENLRSTVDSHIDRDYNFYCLTNSLKTLSAKKIKLLHNWPGWWSKMELHRPDLPCGRTLYFDLDTYVVSSLESLLDYEGDLVMFSSPYENPSRDKRIVRRYQAGVMLFTPGNMAHLYNNFLKSPESYMNVFRSDQDFMGHFEPKLNTFPSEWMIKMASLKNYQYIPEDCIIVTGQPKNVDFRDYSYLSGVDRCKKGDKVMEN